MSTIHDVARYCGVSTATVSRALRGLPNVSPRTRQLVQSAAAELGYVVSPLASGLSTGRHRAVAVVVPSLGRWFYNAVVEGADRALHREGYDVFLIDLETGPGERLRPFSHSLLRKRADAVIALGIDFSAEERRELRALAIPAVVVGGPVKGLRSVGIDDAGAVRIALDHLFALGHQRIAHIGGTDEYGMQYSVATVRFETWRSALHQRGVVPEPWWFGAGGFLMPRAKQVALAMLDRPDRPTAVFAGSDEMAFGALLAARDLGLRVPDDLSVVGIDDHGWSESFSLTTVRQDARAQGERASRVVLDELAGIPVRGMVLEERVELVVRGTTGPATVPVQDAGPVRSAR